MFIQHISTQCVVNVVIAAVAVLSQIIRDWIFRQYQLTALLTLAACEAEKDACQTVKAFHSRLYTLGVSFRPLANSLIHIVGGFWVKAG